MEERITLTALRARGLPRQMLLLAPSPFLEVHTTPGGVAAATTATVMRSTEPFWKTFSYSHVVSNVCGPVTIGLVVKDASSNDALIGCVVLSVDAAQVEGWYPLGDSGAELYVRATRLTYCYGRTSECPRAPQPIPLDEVGAPADGELRSVSSEAGFLFRNGEFIVSIEAVDVPISAKELQVVVKTDDQALRGGETAASLQAWIAQQEVDGHEAKEGTDHVQGDVVQGNISGNADLGQREQSAVHTPKRRHRLRKLIENAKASTSSESAAALWSGIVAATSEQDRVATHKFEKLVNAAGSYALGLRQKHLDGLAAVYDIEAEFLQRHNDEARSKDPLAADDEGTEGAPIAVQSGRVHEGGYMQGSYESGKQAMEHEDLNDKARLMQRKSVVVKEVDEDNHHSDDDDDYDDSDSETAEIGIETAPQEKNEQSSRRDPRRQVDFGSFRFALMYGVVSRMMHIHLLDKSAPLPAPLGLSQEHNIRIPNLGDFTCCCTKECNTHVFRMCLNGSGPGRVTLLVRVQYRRWTPLATSTDVTYRFLEVFSNTDKLPDSIRNSFSRAQELTYLFIGGLFTQHYPGYFERNIRYLKEKLHFTNVEEVPIHTEGSIERNAKDIREAIRKAKPGPKSVVLIGHSKGGVDAIAVTKMFPDVIPFLYGIIAFQAPFGGTYLVDFVSRSKLAVNTISSAIEKLWKGDEAAFVDMGYTARLISLGIVRDIAGVVCNTSNAESGQAKSARSSTSLPFVTQTIGSNFKFRKGSLDYLREVPIVAFASSASFEVLKIRSAANAAGVATMAPAAQVITQYTGFSCDGLVTSHDARIPYADNVLLNDMMHTEPALYVKGTNYPPGQLTASAILLLFEKARRETKT